MTTSGVLCDLEGTVFVAESAIPGAAEALRQLRGRGLSLRFLTNIDSRPPEAVREQMLALGVDLAAEELFTPVAAALRFLREQPNARVLPLVSAALLPLFACFDTRAPASHVLVGDCRERLDYELLDSGFRALRDGAELVALQRGRFFKREDGDHVDTGAIVAALEYAAGVTARVLGKPSPDYFEFALASMGVAAADAIVVGDDPVADIDGGHRAGARTVLVRTGKGGTSADIAGLAAPDHSIDSIAELPDLIATMTL